MACLLLWPLVATRPEHVDPQAEQELAVKEEGWLPFLGRRKKSMLFSGRLSHSWMSCTSRVNPSELHLTDPAGTFVVWAEEW